jgi:hypothetical protein
VAQPTGERDPWDPGGGNAWVRIIAYVVLALGHQSFAMMLASCTKSLAWRRLEKCSAIARL